MFCVSAEQPVDIPCIASCFTDNCTNVCPINRLKTAAYNHDWGLPERHTKGEEDKTNSLTIKVVKFQIVL